jgi:transposase-like protein
MTTLQLRQRDSRAERKGWTKWGEEEARRVLTAQLHSGLSVTEYARREGITPERLFRWRRVLSHPEFLGRAPLVRAGGRNQLLEVDVISPKMRVEGKKKAAGEAPVTVRLPTGVVVEVMAPQATPIEWVSALVKALRDELHDGMAVVNPAESAAGELTTAVPDPGTPRPKDGNNG